MLAKPQREETREVVYAYKGIRVLFAEDLLAKPQRLYVERLGRLVLALALEETREVVYASKVTIALEQRKGDQHRYVKIG